MLKTFLSTLTLLICMPALGQQRTPNISAGPLGPFALGTDVRIFVDPDTGTAPVSGSWSLDGAGQGSFSASGHFFLDLGTGVPAGSHDLNVVLNATGDTAQTTKTFTVTVQQDTLQERSSMTVNTQTIHRLGSGTVYLTTSCTTSPCGSGGLYVDANYIGGFDITGGIAGGGKSFPVNASVGTSVVTIIYADRNGLLHVPPPIPLQVITPDARVPNIFIGSTEHPYAAGTDVRLVYDADYQSESGGVIKALDGNYIGGAVVSAPTVLDLGTGLSVGAHTVTIRTDGTPDVQGTSKTVTFQVQPDDGQGGGTLTLSPQTLHQNGTGVLSFSRPCSSNCGGGAIFVDANYISGFSIADDGTASGMTYSANTPIGTSEVWVVYTSSSGLFHTAGPAPVQVVGPPARQPNMTISPFPATFQAGTDAQFTVNYDYGSEQSGGLWAVDGNYMGGFGVPGTNPFDLGSGLSVGQHEVAIRTVGTPDIQEFTGKYTITITAPSTGTAGNLTCSPSTINSGDRLTCSVTLPTGASSDVIFTANGGTWQTGHPNQQGLVSVSGPLTVQTSGSYPVAYSYPGDPGISPSQGSISVQVNVTSGNQPVPPASGTTLYAYSIEQADGKTSGFDGVGNVTAYTDTVNGTWTAGYDSLNRLTSATQVRKDGAPQTLMPVNAAGQQNFCWQYDSFGNRTTQRASDSAFDASCNTSGTLIPVDAAYNEKNQITSVTGSYTYQYDEAGNVTNDGKYEYLYDGEGRLCASRLTAAPAITGYLYNAEGQRVAKGTVGSWTCDPTSLQITNEYILGLNGEQVTELDGNGNLIRTNVHANGQLIATYDSNGALHYHFSDWLGTRRVQVASNGAVEENCTSGPFGDHQNCAGPGSDATNLHFTGKERDTESGLDYFGARFYGSNMGRWMSPDPSNWGVDFYYPQTWNHYSFVANNPLSNTDPNGLWLTPTHNSIINNSFPGLSKEQRQILQASSKEVDTHQGQEDQFMHGMDSTHNNTSEGLYNPEIGPSDYIQQNEQNAKDIQAAWIASGHTGIAPGALAAFGNALHTITDEYSPSHTGFQKVHWYSYPLHWREGFAMVGMYGNSTRSAQAAARTAFYDVFGSDLGQQATHEKVTVRIIFDPNQKLPDQQQ